MQESGNTIVDANRLRKFVAKQESRAEAAAMLLRIMEQHPDLFREFIDASAQAISTEDAVDDPLYDASMTTAVHQWLARNEYGPFSALADDVLPYVKSDSEKPRNTLYGVVSSLAERGKIGSATVDKTKIFFELTDENIRKFTDEDSELRDSIDDWIAS